MGSTPPLPLTERIPADLPLVVHPNVGRRLLVYGLAYFAWCVVLLGLAALVAVTSSDPGVNAVIVAGGCLVPVVGFLLGCACGREPPAARCSPLGRLECG